MSTQVSNIISSATIKDSLNIFCFIFDGAFETQLCEAFPTYEFFGWVDKAMIPWNIDVYPKPDNFTFLPTNVFPRVDTPIHAIIANNKINYYDEAKKVSHFLHVPLVLVEHTYPQPEWKPEDIYIFNKERHADYHVDVHKCVQDLWLKDKCEDVCLPATLIPYPIHIKPKLWDGVINMDHPYVGLPTFDVNDVACNEVVIIGDYKNEDITISKEIKDSIEAGTNLTVGFYNLADGELSINDVDRILQASTYYINLCQNTKFPDMLLRAMAAGCVVVSNDTPLVVSLLEDIGLDPAQHVPKTIGEFAQLLSALLEVDCDEIGQKQYDYLEMFDPKYFQQGWQDIFTQINKGLYHK